MKSAKAAPGRTRLAKARLFTCSRAHVVCSHTTFEWESPKSYAHAIPLRIRGPGCVEAPPCATAPIFPWCSYFLPAFAHPRELLRPIAIWSDPAEVELAPNASTRRAIVRPGIMQDPFE